MGSTAVFLIFFTLFNVNCLEGETSALKVTSRGAISNTCDIQTLQVEYDLIVEKCDKDIDGSQICTVSDGENFYEYTCVDQGWELTPGTDHHGREKRLIPLIVLIYCAVSRNCFKTAIPNKPPKYTFCPQSGLNYTAHRLKTSVKVTWRKPVAEDDKKVVSETSNYPNGMVFQGLPQGIRYDVSYVAKDVAGAKDVCTFWFTVKYLACEIQYPPMYGRQDCSHNNILGSECKAVCFEGYEIVNGSESSTCQEDGFWDNQPACQKIVCVPPFYIENGKVECENEAYTFESDCSFICDSGYGLIGPSRMECQADRTWSVANSTVLCKDNEPPVISCLSPQIVYADRGGFSTSVHWIEPSATDNVDQNPVIRKLINISQGDILSENDYIISYEAVDMEGNTNVFVSKCDVILTVKVISCPHGPKDELSNSRFIQANCSDSLYYDGVVCNLACDLQLPLNGSDKMTCERNGTSDKGIWNWDSEEQPFCEVVTCPPLEPPDNGAMATDSVAAVPIHVMFCEDGYDIPTGISSQFQGRLSCQDSGEWYPLSEFPDCIIPVIPVLRLPAKLRYIGNCSDESTKDVIKNTVIEYLRFVKADVDKSICADLESDTCKIGNVNVECGAKSRRRRTVKVHELQKRDAENVVIVNFEISIAFNTSGKEDNEAYLDILDKFDSITALMETYVDGGQFDIENCSRANSTFQTESPPNFVCTDSGYLFESTSLKCKPCPKGTYLNSSTNMCEFCEVGEYMDHEAATSCKACPSGFSTLKKGSKEGAACLKLCKPGFVSTTTMSPCYACPVGTYQPLQGQTTCEPCETGQVTSKTNSTSKSQCHVFDYFLSKLEKDMHLGSFGARDSTSITLTTWIRPLSVNSNRISLKIRDRSDDILSLTFTDHVNVEFGLSSYTYDGALTKQWNHISCTVNMSSGSIKFYIGGNLLFSETATTNLSTNSISEGSIVIENQSEGIFMSGFSLVASEKDLNDVTPLLNSCATTSDDAIFSMQDLFENRIQGSSIVIPSTCDPINECETGVCGIHTCINKVNGFDCVCKNSMTGTLCNISPDSCHDNKCLNGDCISLNGTYKCSCADGYTGPFCSHPPVNGGWSEWEKWSACSVSCDRGSRTRKRTCNNPSPSFKGDTCDGSDTEIDSCSIDICPSCPELARQFGTVITCNDKLAEHKECNMTCVRGSVLTNGQKPFEKYRCGPTTGYIWKPTDKLPSCVEPVTPDNLGLRVNARYTRTIPDTKEDYVTSAVEQRATDNICGSCKIAATVEKGSLSKRSSLSSSLTLQFSKEITGNGDIELANYLTDGAETPAMTELLQTRQTINDIYEYIIAYSSSIFDVTVDGVDYTSDNDSISFSRTITCADGNAGAGDLCAKCAAGTKLNFPDCDSCETGTYQPLQGQNQCLPCPAGYTTSAYGATNISECSELVEMIPKNKEKEDESSDKTLTIAVLVAVSFVCLFIITAIVLIVCKKTKKLSARQEINGSLFSLNMIRPHSSMSSDNGNAKVTFNKKNIKMGFYFENDLYD